MKKRLLNHISKVMLTTGDPDKILDLSKSLAIITSIPASGIDKTPARKLPSPTHTIDNSIMAQKVAEHKDVESKPTVTKGKMDPKDPLTKAMFGSEPKVGMPKVSKVKARANSIVAKIGGMRYVSSKCSLFQLKGTCGVKGEKPLTEGQIEHAVRKFLYNDYSIIKGSRLPASRVGETATIDENYYYVIPKAWVE